ncbi:MAG: hypothetical protein A2835_03220 [Candidatus Niyogibacteria bacterium RIFCSPHIGHO2_01_FULL_45_28]|uniref:Transcriptional regulator n=1 Tax=Candidatus Niyogibacteria bacterium RIFCSPLOWO2_02_FULL_45_13 TaxID=1801725 RepID=A0A1G2F0I9_9BACT|nr:MAG: hypothetical protein A2835_03220 [Candidatus Niyogibacteria bacterium RIFCSPHIGHO2_01_FULL_45_28]OGZ31262.1 MAG: hypothetical protein A3J00_01830 [Candidatus Niyogibacteria bacterium RIFCSPLOWO2_02_FULL_45_13]
MADILAELFSSQALVKIMRLFLMNAEEVFDPKEISRRAKINVRKVNYELGLLKRIGFIKPGIKEIEIVFKQKTPKHKKIRGWVLDSDFALLHQLKGLVLNSAPIAKDVLLKKFKTLGSKLKLLVLSGVFLDSDSRLDVVVVGDSISRTKLENILSKIESEIGKELKYALFTTEEFKYRMGMFDHFLREIFDHPHEKLFDKLNV